MRTFELLTIVICLVYLVDYIYTKTSKKIIQLTYVCITAILVILHMFLEYYRWQMIPAYLMVVFLNITCIRSIVRPIKERKKTKLFAKIICSVFTLVYAAIAILLPAILPVFSFDNPKPDYIIGSTSRHLIDASREDLPFSRSKRELMVQIWYPAEKSNNLKRVPYYPHPVMSEALAEMAGLPKFFFNNINLVKTNSYLNVNPSYNSGKYPVILYSHGFGSNRFNNTFLVEELVRHGYIVVGIDHTHYTSTTVFPDERVTKVDVSEKSIINNFNSEIQVWVEDAQFVINELERINREDPVFSGKFDLEKLGYFGHSVGGATAQYAIMKDERIKAAINMDGYIPGYNAGSVGKPFMMMMHDPGMDNFKPGSDNYKMMLDYYDFIKTINDTALDSTYLLQIKNSVHFSFTDSSILTRMLFPTSIAPKRCFTIINSYTISFFDKFIKNEDNGLLNSPSSKYCEAILK